MRTGIWIVDNMKDENRDLDSMKDKNKHMN
jgi:hypothetical protein